MRLMRRLNLRLSGVKQKNTAGSSTHAIRNLAVPLRCVCACPLVADTVDIRVLDWGHKCSFWLDARDTSWLLTYIADEMLTMNVPNYDAAVAAPSMWVANCVVPWLSIRLVMDERKPKTYVGIFVGGPLVGQKTEVGAYDMTEDKWDACIAHGSRWNWSGLDMYDIGPDEVRRAMAYYLEWSCATQLITAWGLELTHDPVHQAAQASGAKEDAIEHGEHANDIESD